MAFASPATSLTLSATTTAIAPRKRGRGGSAATDIAAMRNTFRGSRNCPARPTRDAW